MPAAVVGQCDFGISVTTNQPVADDLVGRILITLKLVLAAIVLAVMIGIAIGIITALRQYSGFDYTITFFTFLFFSLPVFFVAVLLKEFVAIQFNDFHRRRRPHTVVVHLAGGHHRVPGRLQPDRRQPASTIAVRRRWRGDRRRHLLTTCRSPNGCSTRASARS